MVIEKDCKTSKVRGFPPVLALLVIGWFVPLSWFLPFAALSHQRGAGLAVDFVPLWDMPLSLWPGLCGSFRGWREPCVGYSDGPQRLSHQAFIPSSSSPRRCPRWRWLPLVLWMGYGPAPKIVLVLWSASSGAGGGFWMVSGSGRHHIPLRSMGAEGQISSTNRGCPAPVFGLRIASYAIVGAVPMAGWFLGLGVYMTGCGKLCL